MFELLVFRCQLSYMGLVRHVTYMQPVESSLGGSATVTSVRAGMLNSCAHLKPGSTQRTTKVYLEHLLTQTRCSIKVCTPDTWLSESMFRMFLVPEQFCD